MNVATYGPRARFAMTDRGRDALDATSNRLTIGPSSMHWTGDSLVIEVREVSSLPLVSRMAGTITVKPHAISGVELPLTEDGAHIWRPFAPSCDITVDLNHDAWRWSGHGYFDANFGSRPLEQDFSRWYWGRFPNRDGTLCVYDAIRRDGSKLDAAFQFGPDGAARTVPAPQPVPFRTSRWGVKRNTRADPGTMPTEVLSMLGAPFYNRAAVRTSINGEVLTGIHESVDLNRYANPLLKPMIAVRVPRCPR